MGGSRSPSEIFLLESRHKITTILKYFGVVLKILFSIKLTVFIPREAVSEFLALELHVESYWYEDLRLSGVLMKHGRAEIIVAGNSKAMSDIPVHTF